MSGNLLQRTRCPYFRDVGYAACNKRLLGSGCAAIGGENRWHAVLGTSETCIAAYPSDLAVALVALDAAVEVHRANGQRTVPLIDFYLLPDATPHIETLLEPSNRPTTRHPSICPEGLVTGFYGRLTVAALSSTRKDC
jgi:xanthine dehydrogenase YagS FAD-binding subunit